MEHEINGRQTPQNEVSVGYNFLHIESFDTWL